MARFRFQLDPVLGHRERIESERQRECAAAQRAVAEAEAMRDGLAADRDAYRETLRRDHRSFDAELLRATYAHLAYLDRAIEDAEAQVAACRAEAQRRLAVLIAAAKDKKVLETLKIRRREAFDAESASAEQRTLDDMNARSFGRAQLQRGNLL